MKTDFLFSEIVRMARLDAERINSERCDESRMLSSLLTLLTMMRQRVERGYMGETLAARCFIDDLMEWHRTNIVSKPMPASEVSN
jgi:hypothetical protein